MFDDEHKLFLAPDALSLACELGLEVRTDPAPCHALVTAADAAAFIDLTIIEGVPVPLAEPPLPGSACARVCETLGRAFRTDGISAAVEAAVARFPEQERQIRIFAGDPLRYFESHWPEALAEIDRVIGDDPDRYEYADTFRAAPLGDPFAYALYLLRDFPGCCGSYDDVAEVDGRLFLIGFNYGH